MRCLGANAIYKAEATLLSETAKVVTDTTITRHSLSPRDG